MFSEQPQITVKPQSQVLKEGDSAILNCKATSKPPSKITWLKGGDPIKQDWRVSLKANGSVVITNLVPKDTGVYKCSADHDGGWSDSAEANLTVMGQYNRVSKDLISSTLSQNSLWSFPRKDEYGGLIFPNSAKCNLNTKNLYLYGYNGCSL